MNEYLSPSVLSNRSVKEISVGVCCIVSDYRLNPELSRACRLDIPKFCKNVLPTGEEEAHMVEGRVLNCLKIKFVARVSKTIPFHY